MRRLCPGIHRRVCRGLRPGSDRLLRRLLRPTRHLILCAARVSHGLPNGMSNGMSNGVPDRLSDGLPHRLPDSLSRNLSLLRLVTDGPSLLGDQEKITVRAALDEDRRRTVSPPGNILGSSDDSQKCSRCPVVSSSQVRRNIDRPIGPRDFGNTCRLIRFCR